MGKFVSREYGYSFEYSDKNWRAKEITGENSGVELADKRGLSGAPKIIVRVWFLPQTSDDFLIMKVGDLRWLEHPQFGKSLEFTAKQTDFEVNFLLIGKMDRALVDEFKIMTGSFKKA